MTIDVYIEAGAKRVAAGALAWPGWCRLARDEDAAVAALLAYAPRYGSAVSRARQGFKIPDGVRVAERLKGDATTDFGAPSAEPEADRAPVSAAELKRLTALLRAAWRAFDDAADQHARSKLRTGPRGGGRTVEKMIVHVYEADRGYLAQLGMRFKPASGGDMDELHEAFAKALADRVAGAPPTNKVKKLWSPRFAVRRSAWHALDHAWEIEDRAT